MKIKININVIRENICKVISAVESKKIYLVVKSNAYNCGVDEVVKVAYQCGIRKFCTADIQEAINIVNQYENASVLLLKNDLIEEEMLLQASKYSNISVSISSDWEINKVIKFVSKYHVEMNIQVECDIGLRRNGFGVDELKNVLSYLDKRPFIKLCGIFAHRADMPATQEIEHIYGILEEFKLNSLDVHFDCSSMFKNKERRTNSNCVRIGSATYGFDCMGFENVMKLESHIISVKKVPYGMKYGYSQKICKEKGGFNLGIINGGYANGLHFISKVCCKGKVYDVIDFNMEQSYVDFGNDVYELGTKVSLIDDDYFETSLDNIAKSNKTSQKAVALSLKMVEYEYLY